MAQLVSVLEVIESMGMAASLEEDLTPIITSAIEKATLRIESELGSPVRAGTATALFHPMSDLYLGVIPDGFLTLKTDQFFIGTITAVSTTTTFGGEATVRDPLTMVVTSDRGLIRVPAEWDGLYITISYSFGFEDSDTVPSVVRHAILALVPLIFRSSQATTESAESANGKESWELATGMFGRLVNKPGFTYLPMNTVVEV